MAQIWTDYQDTPMTTKLNCFENSTKLEAANIFGMF